MTHVACAFDHVIESFRNELYAGYKTSAGVDPDLLAQFELAERAARALGLVVWPMVEFEADDALAAAAARFRDAPGVEQVVLCSPDKDLAQAVVGERVVVLGPPPRHRPGRGRRDREVRRRAGLDPRLAGAGRRLGRRLPRHPGLGSEVGRRRCWPGIGTSTPSPTTRRSSASRRRGRPASWRACGRAATTPTCSSASRPCASTRRSSRSVADLEWRGVAPDFAELCAELGDEGLARRVEEAGGSR